MLLWSFTALLIFCTDKSNLSELDGDNVITLVIIWYCNKSNLSELGDVIIMVFNMVRNLRF